MDNDGQNHLMPGLKKGEIWDYEAAADVAELWDKDEEMTDSVNQQIQKAQKTNQWGSISGDFQEILTASLKIPMDYRRILSQFRACIISQRRKLTLMKPNRRYGFEFMGSQFEPKTHLLVAVDVSGSIETEDLQNFFSIINRFFSYGVEAINVIAFDKENQEEIDSLPDRLKDPYNDRIYSEESIRFGKKLITGPHIFGAPPNEYYDEILEVKRTPEKDAVVQQIRKLWKLAQKIENGILEDEFPLYKKEEDDRRKRIARSLELSRKKYVESRHAHA